jgi:pantothenate synthetase
MSKLRTIHRHLVDMNMLVDSIAPPIMRLEDYLALSSKARKEHRQYCKKHNIKIPI